jgi:hypothetical protein
MSHRILSAAQTQNGGGGGRRMHGMLRTVAEQCDWAVRAHRCVRSVRAAAAAAAAVVGVP